MRLVHLERVRPLVQVIRALEDLERRMASGMTSTSPLGEAEAGAPAPTPPTPPSATASPPHSEVERLKEELRERGKMLILGALDRAKTIEITEETLRVTFPASLAIHRDTLLESTNKQVIEAVARQVFGRPLALQVHIEADRTPTTTSDRRARAIAEEDPIVRAFVKTFKGEIMEVVAPEEGKKDAS